MTCIAAAGITGTCKVAGGIEKVYMASVPEALKVTPDRITGGKVTDIDDDTTPLVFYPIHLEPGTKIFKENRVVGTGTVGYEKTLAGTIVDYSDDTNKVLEPFEKGYSIAIAKTNSGRWLLMGDMNPLTIAEGEDGVLAEITDLNGYQMQWTCKDGARMREIDSGAIIIDGSTGNLTVTTV